MKKAVVIIFLSGVCLNLVSQNTGSALKSQSGGLRANPGNQKTETGSAYNITVSGKAPGAEGRMIKLVCASDLLTEQEHILSRTRIDSLGRFSLPAYLPGTTRVSLSIDFHEADFYAESFRSYQIDILPYDYRDMKELNPFIKSQDLQIKIRNLPPGDLNTVLSDFNGLYDEFLVKHYNELNYERRKNLVDTLKLQISNKFGEPADPFVRNYIDYKVGAIVLLTKATASARIGMKWFTTKPVLFNNPAYMDLFSSYFTQYITATSRVLKNNDYHAILASRDPYPALMKALKEDTLLKPEILRELVLLKGLWEIFSSSPDDQGRVLDVLNHVHKVSADSNIRLIAGNIVRTVTHLRPSFPAPYFILKTPDQKIVSLSSLKGTIVVLNFWASNCMVCLQDMDRIPELTGKYGDKVKFVSISTDYSPERMQYFIRQKKDWTWTFLHAGEQEEILKSYDVRTIPLFVIIDREGNIFRYNPETSGNELEKEIELLIQQTK